MSSTKRTRFLPEGVSRYRDRHRKWRYRYRRKGHPGGHFTTEFGTDEWRAEYAAFVAGTPLPIASPARWQPGSIGDLVARYTAVPSRLGPTTETQRKVGAIIGKFRDQHGKRRVGDVEFEHIDAILERTRKQRMEETSRGMRPVGGVYAARKLRKELVRLFDFAVKIRMRPDNPVRDAERVKQAPGERSKGFHTWTEDEIARYRQRHPLGTTARLAMELMLWTGQRRGDARELGPRDIVGGMIAIEQSKSGKSGMIVAAPQLIAAITAMPPPPTGASTFLLTAKGEPFTKAGFGNAMRKWCDEAGLPNCTAHGLRKAIMRRMAELGESNQSLKSVSLHSQDDEVALYTAAANQQAMASAAIDRLSKWELSNQHPG